MWDHTLFQKEMQTHVFSVKAAGLHALAMLSFSTGKTEPEAILIIIIFFLLSVKAFKTKLETGNCSDHTSC